MPGMGTSPLNKELSSPKCQVKGLIPTEEIPGWERQGQGWGGEMSCSVPNWL
jgi:hypothetical protein